MEHYKEKIAIVVLNYLKGDKGAWVKDAWRHDFENTKRLGKELGLEIDIIKDNQPISISTVFWARTTTLKKLYSKQWSYEDFPEEPMKDDGEINHAIERILQYVVEDAGYETKIVVSSSFAALFFQQIHDELQYLWGNLNRQFGIHNYRDIECFENRLEHVKEFSKSHDSIFLYGAGIRGGDCLTMCKNIDVIPQAILVTNLENNQKDLEGIPVVSIEQFVPDDTRGIIITVGKAYQDEIVRELEKRGITEYMIF